MPLHSSVKFRILLIFSLLLFSLLIIANPSSWDEVSNTRPLGAGRTLLSTSTWPISITSMWSTSLRRFFNPDFSWLLPQNNEEDQDWEFTSSGDTLSIYSYSEQDYIVLQCGQLLKQNQTFPACMLPTREDGTRVAYYRSFQTGSEVGLEYGGKDRVFRHETKADGTHDVQEVYECLPWCFEVGGIHVTGNTDKCIYVPWNDDGPAKNTHGGAEAYCVEDTHGQGRIINIESEAENDNLYWLLRNTGTVNHLHSADSNGVWLGGQHKGYHANGVSFTEFRWIGSRFDSVYWPWFDEGFTAWNPNEPNDYNRNEDCVEMVSNAARWNDDNCAEVQPFACQRPERRNDGHCEIRDYVLNEL